MAGGTVRCACHIRVGKRGGQPGSGGMATGALRIACRRNVVRLAGHRPDVARRHVTAGATGKAAVIHRRRYGPCRSYLVASAAGRAGTHRRNRMRKSTCGRTTGCIRPVMAGGTVRGAGHARMREISGFPGGSGMAAFTLRVAIAGT